MKRIIISILLIVLTISILSTYTVIAYTNNGLSIDQKIGMNGFVDCNIDNLKAGGILREYHNFGWTYDASTGKCYFKSSWFDFDDFYNKVYSSGITILPCIQQGNNKENREYKPVENGASTVDPASYKIHANVLFNYAARYGSKKVDESKLNLTDGTEPKTGLGYITYYENWNEPDKTWIGEKACFSPEEFAAMCSADYDGHEGTLGDTYGIKQADPNAKLVYGGLAGGSAGVNYLERMKAWSEANRPSKTLPFDVINFHMYCGTKSPEASGFVESATKLINWRDANAKGKEIWITEFGWDTNTSSPRSAPSYDTQRDWIIREYLIADRIGLDRATVYTSRDDADSTNTTQYATCGLTTKKGSEQRKSSWYGVNTLKTTLKGFKFAGVIKEDSDIYIYKYSNAGTDEICYVLWSPTENGSKIDSYELNVGDVSDAKLIQMKDKEETGIKTTLDVKDEIVKVNVSESPIFVKVNKKASSMPEESTNTNTENTAKTDTSTNTTNTNSETPNINTNTDSSSNTATNEVVNANTSKGTNTAKKNDSKSASNTASTTRNDNNLVPNTTKNIVDPEDVVSKDSKKSIAKKDDKVSENKKAETSTQNDVRTQKTKNDNTLSGKEIPYTGNSQGLLIAVIVIMTFAVVTYTKYTRI